MSETQNRGSLKRKLKRVMWIAGVVVSCIFLPLSALPILMIINCVNPMQIGFITSFEVRNDSGRRICVFPIGTFNNGQKAPLPTYFFPLPAIPRFGKVCYDLAPGEKATIYYDWDDINFSELAIRDESGNWRQFVTDPNPPTKDYYEPTQKHFSIPDFEKLAAITPAVLSEASALDGSFAALWMMLLFLLLLISLAIFSWLLIKDKQKNKSAAVPPRIDGI